jgi:hypothetical protein
MALFSSLNRLSAQISRLGSSARLRPLRAATSDKGGLVGDPIDSIASKPVLSVDLPGAIFSEEKAIFLSSTSLKELDSTLIGARQDSVPSVELSDTRNADSRLLQHGTVFSAELASSSLSSRLLESGPVLWYLRNLEAHPLATKQWTSFCGFLIGDVIAQLLTEQQYSPSRSLILASYGWLIDAPAGSAFYVRPRLMSDRQSTPTFTARPRTNPNEMTFFSKGVVLVTVSFRLWTCGLCVVALRAV